MRIDDSIRIIVLLHLREWIHRIGKCLMHEWRVDHLWCLHTCSVLLRSPNYNKRLSKRMWIDNCFWLFLLVHLRKWIHRICKCSVHEWRLVDEW
jgi:hypothetical protein